MCHLPKYRHIFSEEQNGYIIERYHDTQREYIKIKMMSLPEQYAKELARILCEEYDNDYYQQ